MTIKLNRIFYLLILFACFTSCDIEKPIENTHKQIYCQDNLEYLFSVPDSIPQFEIDFGLSKDSIRQIIINEYDTDICDKKIKFGLILSRTVAKIPFFQICTPSYLAPSFPIHSKVQISINNEGNIFINGQIDSIKFIPNQIVKSFLFEKNYHKNNVSLKWKERAPKDSVNKVLSKIEEGYCYVYEKMSQNLFGKPLCNLNFDELNIIKQKLPFIIELGGVSKEYNPIQQLHIKTK